MGERELRWRRATRSGGSGGNGNCVEVATAVDRVLVRDSKDQAGPVLAVNPDEWRAFLRSLG